MKVWCILIDHENRPTREPFQVGVSSETNVAGLRKLVKDEASHLLADTDACDLEVWKCTDSTTNFLDASPEVVVEQVSKAFSDRRVKKLGARLAVAKLIISDEEALLVKLPSGS